LFRTHCAAVILRVAGIYGPGRNPIEWITSGRVGPSRKYVNLIHVEDLAAICLAALERGTPGEAYNVSDGTPRTWKEICHIVRERWAIHSVAEKEDASPGKRVANGKLLRDLDGTLLHPDLYRELGIL
jgi:nucleoside-diphosphate-sugar epimerase